MGGFPGYAGMQGPETEACESGQVRPQPLCQVESWTDGREPQKELRSPATVFTKSAQSGQVTPKIGGHTQTRVCFYRGPRDKKPNGVRERMGRGPQSTKGLEMSQTGVTAQRPARYLGEENQESDTFCILNTQEHSSLAPRRGVPFSLSS